MLSAARRSACPRLDDATLTPQTEFHTLDLVPRVMATALAVSIFALQSATGAFHTHAVTDDHVEHRHAPAIHHHDDHWAGSGPHVEESDFTPKTITLTVPAGTADGTPVVRTASAMVFAPPIFPCLGRAAVVVTRSHDPPHRTPVPVRGPPHFLTT